MYRIAFIFLLPWVLSSCGTESVNSREYVISQSQEEIPVGSENNSMQEEVSH